MKAKVINPFQFKGIHHAKGDYVTMAQHAYKMYNNAGFVEEAPIKEEDVPEEFVTEKAAPTKAAKKK